MPVFAYKAIGPSGSLTENRIEAASAAQARAQLASRGHKVVQITELAAGQPLSGKSIRRGKKVPADEVATVVRQMSVLLRAGVPLVEGLDGLAEQARSQSLRVTLEQITSDVSQGMALSEAFEMHPHVFPTLAVEMARIAEAGGDLSESMAKLADHMENAAEIQRKVKSALAYPVVIMALSFITLVVMITFILPRFMKLFDKMGAKIPWTTKLLMDTSSLVTTYWYAFLLGGVAIVFGCKKFAASPLGKRIIDTSLLKMPVLGEVVTKIVLNRVIASMATLLASGVPMVQTLKTSAAAADNELVTKALLDASEDVAQGTATSQALKTPGVFPPLIVQMVASGEKTGELANMLEYICAMYQRETDAKVKALTSIIEPIMIVILGVIVGFIAMSVIVPIYSLVGGVK